MDEREAAARIEDLPVIGSIATMPSRAGTFSMMFDAARAQVDRIFVFLDGFDDIPSNLRDVPNCHAELIPTEAGLHSYARFLAPHRFASDGIVVMFDDDILYPPDYVSTVRAALAHYGGKAVVGFGGTNFTPPHKSYIRDRSYLNAADSLDNDLWVHELAAGTAAFVASSFRPDPHAWAVENMADLYLAAEALASRLALIALKRERDWIRTLATNQPDSILARTRRDDHSQSYFMRDLLTQYAKPTWSDWWNLP